VAHTSFDSVKHCKNEGLACLRADAAALLALTELPPDMFTRP
jgi:hypothetical protein